MSWKTPDGNDVSAAGAIASNDLLIISRNNEGKMVQANLFEVGENLGFITSASVDEFITSQEASAKFLLRTSSLEFLTSASVSTLIDSFGFLTDGLTSASADARYLTSAITTAQTCALVESYGYATTAFSTAETCALIEGYSFLSSALTTAQADSRYLTSTSAAALFLTTSEADTLFMTTSEVESLGYITSASVSALVSNVIANENLVTSAGASAQIAAQLSGQGLLTSASIVSLVEAYGYITSASASSQSQQIVSAYGVEVSRDSTPQLGGYLDLRNRGYTTTANIATSVGFTKMQVARIGTSGKAFKANAAAENLGQGMLLLALSAITTGDASASFLAEGFVSTSGLSDGSIYYLDTSAGGLTTTKPTGLNEVVRKVGQARTSTLFYFSPSNDFTVIDSGQSPANVPNQITDLVATPADQEVDLTFTEPDDNNSAITAYIAEYQDGATATASAWTCVTADVSEARVVVSGLTNGVLYSFRVYAKNAVGNAPISDVVSAAPTITNDLTSVITSGLVAWYDAKTYVSTSSNWPNSIGTPADGEAASVYDLNPTDNTLYDTNRWVMDNTGYFPISSSANTTFIESLHKTDSTTPSKWTWFCQVGSPTAAAGIDSLFGTADTSGNVGVALRIDSGGAMKYDQYHGAGKSTTCAPAFVVSANRLYNLAVAVDTSADRLYFANAIAGTSITGWTTVNSPFTANVSANATFPLIIGGEGGGNNVLDSDVELYTQMFINRAITSSEVNRLFAWADTYYSPPAATAPGQVSALNATPADGAVNLSWTLSDDGGAAITNYPVEYKITTTAVWTSANNSTTNTFDTVSGLAIGTTYDFRVRAINNAGAGAYSTTASATPTSSGGVSAPYSLTPYKITLPITSTGSDTGNAHEILQPEMLTYESAYFVRGDGTFKFVCPDGGATTATASYSRTEFRHLENIDYTVCTEDELEFAVSAIPDGHKTVVHQIHGFGTDDSPYFKTVYTGKDNGTGVIRALVKTSQDASDTVIFLKTGVTNGDRTVLRTVYTGNALQFYADGVLVSTQPMARDSDQYYWKRGNYYQNNARVGNNCAVVHYTNGNNYIGNP